MHGALIIILLAAMATGGCTTKSTDVKFDQQADEHGVSVMIIKADGATLDTDTDQAADGYLDLSGLVKAAKAKAGGTAASVIDTIKDAITGDDKTDPAVGDEVTPTETGTVEEVDVTPTETGTVEEVD